MSEQRRTNNSVTMEDVELLPGKFRNFSGRPQAWTAKGGLGTRQASIYLAPEQADEFERLGWPVKYLKALEEGDVEAPYLTVTLRYDNFPPKVVMISTRGQTILDEDTVGMLDWAEIERVDVTLNPSFWEVNEKSGVKIYVKNMYVTIYEDDLTQKYSDIPMAGE